MSDELAKNFLQIVEKMVQGIRGKRLVFFVAGRAGWGKSSTVNSLVGEYVSEVKDDEVGTADVTGFDFDMKGVQATIFDTPGLCDGRGNDEIYIQTIRSKVKNPDSMLYVNRLDETRLTDNDIRGIKIISEALGSNIWENAVIVFTFANNVNASEYLLKLDRRKKLIQKAIADCIKNDEIANQIPVVAIDNKNRTTPDGKEWLGQFYTVVVDRVSKEGTILLLCMLTESITRRTHLNNQQKENIRKKFVATVFQTVATSAGIGVVIAGLIGSPVIIGFSGAGIIGTLLGAWLSKDKEEL